MEDDYEMRFGGIGRLFGRVGLERLRQAHVAVVGVGGVGSWAAEALARSGVGRLTLVDLDEVCVSNVNRQVPALTENVGRFKVEVMAERIRGINPQCVARPVTAFFTSETAEDLFREGFDYVFDAIDRLSSKSLLIALCGKRGIPVLVSGSAGGRRDPTQVRVADLAEVTHDRLARQVRKCLRRLHGFSRDKASWGIPCVYSSEPAVYPAKDGEPCARRDPESELRLDCDSGYGTASFVTGAFGLAAAARIVSELAVGPG